jgi:hypothetical protein
MNPLRHDEVSAIAVRFGVLATILVVALSGAASLRHTRAQQRPDSSLIVHEWGTFTSIAGADGTAVEWLPIATKSDLPTFVEHYHNPNVKSGVRGTVRMETPIIYFYSPRQTTVSVDVSFAAGLITEWFPHASRVRPSDVRPIVLNPQSAGSITWGAVTVMPTTDASFSRASATSHYYAARQTSASAVSVQAPAGNQLEKFLFYRGVSVFVPPLSAKLLATGQLQVQSNTGAIAALILFERRGTKLGYRVSSLESDATLSTPSTSGTLDSLRSDFEDALVAQGLYRDEAHAMLETWGDSWFEEGSRLFYVVPRPFVDSVVPLSINPAPTRLTRVFVGRIELITPATENAVESALLSGDHETLGKYGRFLEPIVDAMITRHADPTRVDRLRQALIAYYGSQLSALGASPNDL